MDTMQTMSPTEPSDSVDRLIAEWAAADPTLDVDIVGVVHRVRLLRAHIESALEENFRSHRLTGTGFGVLSALIRAGDPHRLNQRDLVEAVHLSPGTVSLRIDQLEVDGLVRRMADPEDRRSTLVELTDRGREVFDRVAPGHLVLQQRLVASLTDAEQRQLIELLRRLLVGFEPAATEGPLADFGLTVAPAHESMAMQAQMGMDPVPGLLVRSVRPGSPAETRGLFTGDLIVSTDGTASRSALDIVAAVRTGARLRVRRGGSEHDLD